MGHHLRRPNYLAALLLLVLAVGAAVAPGCGNTKDSIVGTGVETRVYSNADFGFSVRYPARCDPATPPIDTQSAPGRQFELLIADPNGAIVGGTALDVFSVDVYGMTAAAKPGDLKAHRSDFEGMASGIIGKPSKLSMIKPFALASMGGKPALTVEYGFAVKGQPVFAVSYLVPLKDRVYWISAQSTPKTAKGSDMGVTLDSFRFE